MSTFSLLLTFVGLFALSNGLFLTPNVIPLSGAPSAAGVTATGSISACDIVYYSFDINDFSAEDYLKIELETYQECAYDGTTDHGCPTQGTQTATYLEFMPPAAVTAWLLTDLTSDDELLDYGSSPSDGVWSCTPNAYSGSNPGDAHTCEGEFSCSFGNGRFYIGVAGADTGISHYALTVYRRQVSTLYTSVSGYALQPNQGPTTLPPTQETFIYGRNDPFPCNASLPCDPVQNYDYFQFEWNGSDEGQFLVVTLSDVIVPERIYSTQYSNNQNYYYNSNFNPVLRVNYGSLPVPGEDDQEDCSHDICINAFNELSPTGPCSCSPDWNPRYENCHGGPDPDQYCNTCNVTVSPCYFYPGEWFVSVEVPAVNITYGYTLEAEVFAPEVTNLAKNELVNDGVANGLDTHYRLVVTNPDQLDDGTHLRVSIDNIVGGRVTTYLYPGALAGGPESCNGSIAECTSPWACNLILNPCDFAEYNAMYDGVWYIAVHVTADVPGQRYPIDYRITATWESYPEPTMLVPGMPVSNQVYEGLYDFYQFDVTSGSDAFVITELFVDATDTAVKFYMFQDMGLNTALPGGQCYGTTDDARPFQYYCQTGGDAEACNFMIKTCELEDGPLYLSVYGDNVLQSPGLGNNTWYKRPVSYTLWADYATPMGLQDAVTYTDTVYANHYNHYYYMVEEAVYRNGDSLTVEFNNIQRGSIQGYVNKDSLAGECPCWANVRNCTGSVEQETCIDNMGPPSAVSDASSPGAVCRIDIENCMFESGLWYVSAQGLDANSGAQDIGYTVTVTHNAAPDLSELSTLQIETNSVAQDEYNHYQLVVDPTSSIAENHNLVLKLTYQQYARPLAADNQDGNTNAWANDALTLYLGKDRLATSDCCEYECEANANGFSYCTIIVPYCFWSTDEPTIIYASVYGTSVSLVQSGCVNCGTTRYTLEASLETVDATSIGNGVVAYGTVLEDRYNHYYIDVSGDPLEYMFIELYTNEEQSSQAPLTLRANIDAMAGARDGRGCFEYEWEWNTTTAVTQMWQPCELREGRYYFSVYGRKEGTSLHTFFDRAVEYTLRISLKTLPQELVMNQPITGWVFEGDMNHYHIHVPQDQIAVGDQYLFTTGTVKGGQVTTYMNYPLIQDGTVDPAGPCPCYTNTDFCPNGGDHCVVDSTFNVANHLMVPYCMLKNMEGHYFYSVVGEQQNLELPTGYTVRPHLRSATIESYRLSLGLDKVSGFRNETLQGDNYIHYRLDFSQAALEAGGTVSVHVADVLRGTVDVFFHIGEPGEAWEGCYTDFLGTAAPLSPIDAQIDPCRFADGQTYYISLRANTQVDYIEYPYYAFVQNPVALTRTDSTDNRGGALVQHTTNRGQAKTFYLDPSDVGGLTASSQEIHLQFTNITFGGIEIFVNRDTSDWFSAGGSPYAGPRGSIGGCMSECQGQIIDELVCEADAGACRWGGQYGIPFTYTTGAYSGYPYYYLNALNGIACLESNDNCTVIIPQCHAQDTRYWITVVPLDINTPNDGATYVQPTPASHTANEPTPPPKVFLPNWPPDTQYEISASIVDQAETAQTIAASGQSDTFHVTGEDTYGQFRLTISAPADVTSRTLISVYDAVTTEVGVMQLYVNMQGDAAYQYCDPTVCTTGSCDGDLITIDSCCNRDGDVIQFGAKVLYDADGADTGNGDDGASFYFIVDTLPDSYAQGTQNNAAMAYNTRYGGDAEPGTGVPPGSYRHYAIVFDQDQFAGDFVDGIAPGVVFNATQDLDFITEVGNPAFPLQFFMNVDALAGNTACWGNSLGQPWNLGANVQFHSYVGPCAIPEADDSITIYMSFLNSEPYDQVNRDASTQTTVNPEAEFQLSVETIPAELLTYHEPLNATWWGFGVCKNYKTIVPATDANVYTDIRVQLLNVQADVTVSACLGNVCDGQCSTGLGGLSRNLGGFSCSNGDSECHTDLSYCANSFDSGADNEFFVSVCSLPSSQHVEYDIVVRPIVTDYTRQSFGIPTTVRDGSAQMWSYSHGPEFATDDPEIWRLALDLDGEFSDFSNMRVHLHNAPATGMVVTATTDSCIVWGCATDVPEHPTKHNTFECIIDGGLTTGGYANSLSYGQYAGVSMSSCSPSTKNKQFFFEVYNYQQNFTLDVYVDTPTPVTLEEDTWGYSTLYNHEYDHWHFNIPDHTLGKLATVYAESECGTFEMMWNIDHAAGVWCMLDGCVSSAGHSENGASTTSRSCMLALDADQVLPGDYYIAVHGLEQDFNDPDQWLCGAGTDSPADWCNPAAAVTLPIDYLISFVTLDYVSMEKLDFYCDEHTGNFTAPVNNVYGGGSCDVRENLSDANIIPDPACNGNGDCWAGECVCDFGWAGSRCQYSLADQDIDNYFETAYTEEYKIPEYYFDIENVNLGASLTVNFQGVDGFMAIQRNHVVLATTQEPIAICGSGTSACAAAGNGNKYTVTIPTCQLTPGRYFVFISSTYSTISIKRTEPIYQYADADVEYSGAVADGEYFLYRFDSNPTASVRDPGNSVKAYLYEVYGGAAMTMSVGPLPYWTGVDGQVCEVSMGYPFEQTCNAQALHPDDAPPSTYKRADRDLFERASAEEGRVDLYDYTPGHCNINIGACISIYARRQASLGTPFLANAANGLQNTQWFRITGTHSVCGTTPYKFRVRATTNWQSKTVGESSCEELPLSGINYYYFDDPATSDDMLVVDVAEVHDGSITLAGINPYFQPSPGVGLNPFLGGTQPCAIALESGDTFSLNVECPRSGGAWVFIQGEPGTTYRLNSTDVPAHATPLNDSLPYDHRCPSDAQQPGGLDLYVIDLTFADEFDGQVWGMLEVWGYPTFGVLIYHPNARPAPLCFTDTCNTAATGPTGEPLSGACSIVQDCGATTGLYYFGVVANGPYTITAGQTFVTGVQPLLPNVVGQVTVTQAPTPSPPTPTVTSGPTPAPAPVPPTPSPGTSAPTPAPGTSAPTPTPGTNAPTPAPGTVAPTPAPTTSVVPTPAPTPQPAGVASICRQPTYAEDGEYDWYMFTVTPDTYPADTRDYYIGVVLSGMTGITLDVTVNKDALAGDGCHEISETVTSSTGDEVYLSLDPCGNLATSTVLPTEVYYVRVQKNLNVCATGTDNASPANYCIEARLQRRTDDPIQSRRLTSGVSVSSNVTGSGESRVSTGEYFYWQSFFIDFEATGAYPMLNLQVTDVVGGGVYMQVSADSPWCPGMTSLTGNAWNYDNCEAWGPQYGGDYMNGEPSCQIFIDNCLQRNARMFVNIFAIAQFDFNEDITFTLTATELDDYTVLSSAPVAGSFNTGQDQHYYRAEIADPVESVRVHITQTSANYYASSPLMVSARDWPCLTWVFGSTTYVPVRNPMELTCWGSEATDGADIQCDFELKTRAEVDTFWGSYFFFVSSNEGTYEIAATTGRDGNCEVPSTLDFCASYVGYPVWQWSDYSALDAEAECLYNDLRGSFYSTSCDTGISDLCDDALVRFACYETFHMCDEYGFQAQTCSEACEAVEVYCENWFETVELPQFNCTSDHFADKFVETCTGLDQRIFWPAGSFQNDLLTVLIEDEEGNLIEFDPMEDDISVITQDIQDEVQELLDEYYYDTTTN